MNCELVMTVKEMETSNDNWLKLRKAGIGGHDALEKPISVVA